MTDFITSLSEVLKMAADISLWRLLFLLLCVVVCIIAWQSPHLLKAYLLHKKQDANDDE